MFNSTLFPETTSPRTAQMLVPLIRAAATLGFIIAPCSMGFVIIALSDHLIRSILVGEDPEMLLSELQNQFPNEHLRIADEHQDVAARVVELIDRPHLPR